MTTITIREESTSGEIAAPAAIEIPTERLTVRELIRSQVYQQVKDQNVQVAARSCEPDNGIQLTETERALNGVRDVKPKPVPWKAQLDKAIAAFESQHILIFIDDQQITSLDQELTLNSQTDICFLRLTMLMGG